MLKTFKGGLHVYDNKNTRDCPITNIPAPKIVSIPLQQHIGAPALALVLKGEHVKKGQIIGDFTESLCCPVHASVSGTVLDIEQRIAPNGNGFIKYIVIENDFCDEFDETLSPYSGDIFSASSDEIVSIVRNAGISGQGGASFPTHAKIQSAIGKAAEIIINCAECEPYITENHRLMLECPEKVIGGARILMHATDAKHMTIAIENNKMDAVSIISEKCKNYNNIAVKALKTKYPQGDERQLMYVIKGIKLPSGKLPADYGCVIFNAETCVSVYNAVYSGLPLIDTVITVDGDAIKTPKNIRVPIGTSIGDIIDFCGGIKDNLSKIVSGGPMMGHAQWDLKSVVMKNTSALLFLSKNKRDKREGDCIHCGKCVSVCPMNLMPNYLASFAKKEDLENAQAFNILSCVECGCCTYICPGSVPVVQYIRTGKTQLQAKLKKEAKL